MDHVIALIAVAGLGALTFVIVALLRLESPWLQPLAIVRATVQLGVVSLILTGVVADGRLVAAFLVLMVVAASVVVVRRGGLELARIPVVAGILVVSCAVPVAVVFLSGALPFQPRYVLAFAGIVVGNAMTVCSLMTRSLTASFVTGRDEIEAWLALGARPRQAASRVVRVAASTSLIPATDQTRTTGIVVLPGAFVGAVFAGSPPLEAAIFQLLVLAGVLAVGAVSVALVGRLLGAPTRLPVA